MKEETNKEKFLKLVEPYNEEKHGKTMRDIKWRIANREMLRGCRQVSLKILQRLDEIPMTKIALAHKIGISTPEISKYLAGSTLYPLELAMKIEDVLGIQLIVNLDGDFK